MSDSVVLTLVDVLEETVLNNLSQQHLTTLLLRIGSILAKGANYGMCSCHVLINTIKTGGN